MTLRELLEDASEDLDGVDSVEVGEGLEWRRGARPFAALAGDVAEFRLDPLVAAAALRTPDTSQSTRGADWVGFAPAELDDHAADRAEAWFGSAWRRASSA
jgi:hypothetical protein